MKKERYQAAKGIVLAFLLLTGNIHAQQSDSVLLYHLDTMNYQEQPSEEATVEEVDEEKEDGDEMADEEKDQHYFLQKANPGNQPGSLYLRRLDDSAISKLKRDGDFWYANTVFKKKRQEEDDSGSSSFYAVIEPFLWLVIIAGFITFLVIYLSNSNVRIFRKSKAIGELDDEAGTDDIFIINYQKEIDKAVNAGNYRIAVRLLFLRLLRDLSEKNRISYDAGKTNFDYLLQVSQAAWYRHFFRLTRSYEYIWYGQFEIDRERYEAIKNDFTDLDKQLNN